MRRLSAVAAGAVVLLLAGLATVPTAQAEQAVDPRLEYAQTQVQAYCTDLVDDATTNRQRNTRADLCAMWRRELADLTPSPSPTPSATATPSPTPSPSPSVTTPPPTTLPPSPTPSPTGFPDETNTGVPPGTVLTAYSGPCTITTDGTIIDAKTVNCVLVIHAAGVVIKWSLIRGGVFNSLDFSSSFTVEDSEVVALDDTGIWDVNFTVRRTYIHGSGRGLYCQQNCLVEDSYIVGSSSHASGARVLRDAVYRHNTIWCKRFDTSADGGCSANLTMYQEFGIATNVLIENNFFPATPAWFCAYGGDAGSGNLPGNATFIRFVDNVFARGAGACSADHPDGYPITNFAASRTGNQWSNNRYTDGVLIPTP